MMGGILQGKPTHSINRFKKEFYHKRDNSPREEGKEEHAPEPAERDCRHPSSDDSLSPCRRNREMMTISRESSGR